MSIGALVSRSISYSSTSIILVPAFFCSRESACCAAKAQDSPTICCGLLGRWRARRGLAARLGGGRRGRSRLQRLDPRLERLGLLAGGDGDRLDRLELVAAHHVEPADPFAHPLAERAFRLA